MPNFHKIRVTKRVIKIIFTLFIVAVNAILLWRIFFSTSLPDTIENLSPNAPLAKAYAQYGEDLEVRYQNNFTTTYGATNTGYFSNSEAVFITQANQVQVVIRYPHTTLEHLQQDYALPEKPDKALDWFTFSLVKTTDLTPNVKEDNLNEENLSFERILPTSVIREESSLYTFYRITFDGVTVEELTAEQKTMLANKEPIDVNYTIGMFLDIHYVGDAQATNAYGTLCVYDCEMPWETRALSGDEKESFVNFPIG